MRKRICLSVQMAGVASIVAGVAVFSLAVASIVFGLLLIAIGEAHG